MRDDTVPRSPQENPYAPPSHQIDLSGSNPLLIPAICLIVLASIFLMGLFASLPGQIARLGQIDTSTPEGQGELAGGIMSFVVWVAMMIQIIIGSVSMLRLRGYRQAMVAAIVAIIPFCSPCLFMGIPFGIWSLVLLRRTDVRARFR